jgi:hypothetical protein
MHAFRTANPIELKFKQRQALHGDVIIEKIDDLPEGFESLPKSEDGCLAYGEVTGHSHKLFRMTDPDLPTSVGFDLRHGPDGIKFLVVKEPVEVRHQEHDPRIIPPGIYRTGIQREYDPFTKRARAVAD